MGIAAFREALASIAATGIARPELVAAAAAASPVAAAVMTFDALKAATDRAGPEEELLRAAAVLIERHRWHDRAGEAAAALDEIGLPIDDAEG